MLEWDVVLVRSMAAAPADMQANLFFWNIAQRMIERLDAQSGIASIVVNAHLREHLPAVGKVRIVDLQIQSSVGDGAVLVVHCIGDGKQELFVGLVILVEKPVLDGAGCNCR